MANVKNGALREIIIDRCLQSRRGYSTQEILEKCNHALERRGDYPITASNTIRNDIMSMANRWHVNVESVKDGRNVRYRYEDPNFSIFNSPLNEDEIVQLTQSVSLLRRFEGMEGFEWVDELNAHLQQTVNTESSPIVGFDRNENLKGMRHFTPLFNYIGSKQAINIKYKSFKSEKTEEVTIHPYYLKEYNQRWFLFGLNDSYRTITNLALDRIEEISKSSVKYVENTDIDFQHYLEDVIGVSIKPLSPIEEVRLWVDREQLPYALTKPLHSTQKVIEKNEDGSAIITINVKPNFELEQLILSFGERVEVLSPQTLRDAITERLKKNIEHYQSVHLD